MAIKRRMTGVETPIITHKRLVDAAERWLRNAENCTVTAKELVTHGPETPDAIGFKGAYSILVECKTSRADFLADRKKYVRRSPDGGMGSKRYFAAPVGLLSLAEIPDGWGLLDIYKSETGNISAKEVKESGHFTKSQSNEIILLVSIIRRLKLSTAVFVEQEVVNNGK